MTFWMDWRRDLIIACITGIIVVISILFPKYLKEKKKISRFVARKIVHSLAGLAVFITPYLDHPILAGILALIMTIVTRTSGKKSKVKIQRDFYNAINEAEEEDLGYLQGPFAYCLAITVLVFAFLPMPDKYYYPIAAILIMMFADTAASIIGKKYGKHHINIPWVGNKRTLEGSIAFILVAIALSFLTFLFFGYLFPGNSKILAFGQVIILSLFISFISTILELFSPSKYDDLIIPIGSTLLISLLAFFMGFW